MIEEPLIGLRATGAAVGRLVWSERRFAAMLAASARLVRDPATALDCATLARHAHWRAGQWLDVLPTQPGLDPATLVTAPSDAPPALLVDVLPSEPVELANTRTDVLAWLLAHSLQVGRRADRVSEGPTVRAAARVAADLTADQGPGSFDAEP